MRLLVQAVGERVRTQFDRPWGSNPRALPPRGDRRACRYRPRAHPRRPYRRCRARFSGGLTPCMSSSAKATGWRRPRRPFDPGQDPADLVVLSFSDSDLGAFRGRLAPREWARCPRCGSPISSRCDTRFRSTPMSSGPSQAPRASSSALIGGEAYWPYGLATLRDLAQRQRHRARRPARRRPPRSAAGCALHPAGLHPAPPHGPLRSGRRGRRAGRPCPAGARRGPLRRAGRWCQIRARLRRSICPVAAWWPMSAAGPAHQRSRSPSTAAYLTAADTAPDRCPDRRAAAPQASTPMALFAPSLKAPEAAEWLRRASRRHARPPPSSTPPPFRLGRRMAPRRSTPPGCPVFQVALSTARAPRLGRLRTRPVARRSRHACRPARG